MEFGFFMPARVDSWRVAQRAEQLGFTSAWLYDSQMIYADTYVCLALCAEHTTRIRLGNGVTNPITRIAPLMASALGTINQLAPGRAFMGIGTGYSTMRAAGLLPAKTADFREYIRVVRALLRGEDVEYTLDGRERTVQMIHRDGSTDPTFMNFNDPVPIWVAAGGPKTRAVAGELGDGLILGGRPTMADVEKAREEMRPGAEIAGRRIEDIPITLYTSIYVLEPGEESVSDGIRRAQAAMLQSSIGCYAAGYRPGTGPAYGERITDDEIPVELLPLVREYRRLKESVRGPGRLDGPAWYITAFEGHVWRLHPELLRLVTDDVLRSRHSIVGTADEVLKQLKEYEACGVTQVGTILADSVDTCLEMVEIFGKQIIARY